MSLSVMAAFSQFQREEISARAKAVVEHLQSQRKVFNHPLFGFRRVGDRLTPDPAEIQTLRRIRELHRLGATLRELGRMLDKEDRRPKNGGSWHPQVLAHTIRNLQPGGAYERLGVRL